ncbi:hypothetical protein [Paracoccus marcusii]|uniref:hypothetical protein n=1 Tax=Paracoccus marcusii TaxID=59779 RepID=UPI00326761DA
MDCFKLTDAQWDAVVAELDTLGHSATEANRIEIETICTEFIQRRSSKGKVLPSPGRQAKQWSAIQKAAARLHKEITADADIERKIKNSFHACQRPDIGPMISALEGMAEEMAEHMSDRPKALTASDPDLQDLQRRLISFWIGCGGAATSSTSPKNAKAGGPLIRFTRATLVSAVEAVGMKPPSNEAIREAIRRVKGELDNHLLESLAQVASAEPFTARKVMDHVENLRRNGRLKVNTLPLDNTVAAQAKWTDWWAPSDPAYWPVALAWCLEAIKIDDTTQLDAWLEDKGRKDSRVFKVGSSENAERVWKVSNPQWPIKLMRPPRSAPWGHLADMVK